MAARVVVGAVGDPEPAGVLQQPIAGKAVADGEVVVLRLGGEVQAAVFARPGKARGPDTGAGPVLLASWNPRVPAPRALLASGALTFVPTRGSSSSILRANERG